MPSPLTDLIEDPIPQTTTTVDVTTDEPDDYVDTVDAPQLTTLIPLHPGINWRRRKTKRRPMIVRPTRTFGTRDRHRQLQHRNPPDPADPYRRLQLYQDQGSRPYSPRPRPRATCGFWSFC